MPSDVCDVHACVCVGTHDAQVMTCTYVRVRVQVHLYVQICMCLRVCVCTYVCMEVMYACVSVHVRNDNL